MPALDFSAAAVADACRANSAAVAGSLNLCFGRTGGVAVGEPRPRADRPASLDGPGLAVSILADGIGLVALIPADLPLPDWYARPNESQASRLQSLAAEWAVGLLPAGAHADVTTAVAVPNLADAGDAACPDEIAELIPLLPGDAAPDAVADPPGTFYLLTPVSAAVPAPDEKGDAPADRPAVPAADARRRRMRRLLPIPVKVVVYLAERKIEMGQLLGLAPGSLITFNKNCEDLLDLYVNNRLYCRGEAVKIGETFGLKFNEVGATRRREEHVF